MDLVDGGSDWECAIEIPHSHVTSTLNGVFSISGVLASEPAGLYALTLLKHGRFKSEFGLVFVSAGAERILGYVGGSEVPSIPAGAEICMEFGVPIPVLFSTVLDGPLKVSAGGLGFGSFALAMAS